jgi:pre-mRNA 3'-end-processing factor FIP1
LGSSSNDVFIFSSIRQQKRPPGLHAAQADNIRKSSSTPTPAAFVKTGTPVVDAVRHGSQPPNDGGRPGTDYPARHTSTLDPLDGNPVHPATGKPILSTDFDVDFPSESSKPWRKPGADITDYFNYGFDEFTWASYCLKQQQMPKEVKEITQQAEQMKAFVEGIPSGAAGMPGMPGLPVPAAAAAGPGGGGPDMSQMGGMPSEAQMQQMFAAMTSQGLDPMSMDTAQFMQLMGAGGAGMMGGGQPQQAPTGPSGGGFSGGGGGGGGGTGFDQGGGGGGSFGRGRGKGGRRNW